MGIHLSRSDTKSQGVLIKHPIVLYGILLSSLFHLTLVIHYAWIHITDFMEVTDSMPLLCQLLLCLLKTAIFLYKRQEILLLIREIHIINLKAKHEEKEIVCRENAKDYSLCFLYLRLVIVTGSFGVIHPVIYGLYMYATSEDIVLNESNKASYFWDHSHLLGYSMLYMLNIFSVYFTCCVSLAFDTLFSWFVSNIVAQFHIISCRFDKLASKFSKFDAIISGKHQSTEQLIECIQYHRKTLYLAERLNDVFGEIIFIKFLIVCTEICSLVFRVSRPNDSLAEVAYKCLFLCAVALQLVLYCWNGQRIKDESMQVTTSIYCSFDWSNLSKSYKKMLLFSMMRSQRNAYVRGVLFEVDLTLYLWVFKTAGSLITALKTLDENQN